MNIHIPNKDETVLYSDASSLGAELPKCSSEVLISVLLDKERDIDDRFLGAIALRSKGILPDDQCQELMKQIKLSCRAESEDEFISGLLCCVALQGSVEYVSELLCFTDSAFEFDYNETSNLFRHTVACCAMVMLSRGSTWRSLSFIKKGILSFPDPRLHVLGVKAIQSSKFEKAGDLIAELLVHAMTTGFSIENFLSPLLKEAAELRESISEEERKNGMAQILEKGDELVKALIEEKKQDTIDFFIQSTLTLLSMYRPKSEWLEQILLYSHKEHAKSGTRFVAGSAHLQVEYIERALAPRFTEERREEYLTKWDADLLRFIKGSGGFFGTESSSRILMP